MLHVLVLLLEPGAGSELRSDARTLASGLDSGARALESRAEALEVRATAQDLKLRATARVPSAEAAVAVRADGTLQVRSEVNSELNFPPNFEGLVLGCIDADFCK